MESDLVRLARLSQLAGALRAIEEQRPFPATSRMRLPRRKASSPVLVAPVEFVEFLLDPALLGER